MSRPSLMDHDNVTGASAIVLAGGRSSRMGRPKALLLFDDEPLIVHIVTALRSLCADVVVVGAPDQELPSLPATVIRDAVAYQGPVGGISYGLAAISGEVAIVVACDSAFLSLPLLGHLLDRIPKHDVVVPEWGGRLQPLHAVYRKAVLPILEQQLARGELRPVTLFDKVRTCRVDEDEIRRFDPDGSSFFNMNTPEDYAEARERWDAVHGRRGARTAEDTIAATRAWIERVVIGLNLCPLAKAVYASEQIRYVVSGAQTADALLEDLERELRGLAEAAPDRVETTLLIHPQVLTAFLDYNDFLDVADAAVDRLGLTGVLQVASFHPQYQFAGTTPDEVTNYTNRSPVPMLHLLREASVEAAVAAFPDAAEISERNIETMRRLGLRRLIDAFAPHGRG